MTTRNILRIASAMILAAVFALTSTAFAQTPPDRGARREKMMERHEKMKHAFKKLNLNADQKSKIKALRDKFKTTNAGTISQLKSLREQMKQLKQSGADKDQIKALREQMKTEAGKLREQRKLLKDEIKGVLTPEQIEELKKLREKEGHGGIQQDENPADVE